jgi:hypothetical protein
VSKGDEGKVPRIPELGITVLSEYRTAPCFTNEKIKFFLTELNMSLISEGRKQKKKRVKIIMLINNNLKF